MIVRVRNLILSSGWPFPVLAGVLWALGEAAATLGVIRWTDATLWAALLWTIPACLIGFPLILRVARRLSAIPESESASVWWRPEHREAPQPVLRDAARLLACWTPWMLLVYPGVVYWDTGDQIAQYLGLPAFSQPTGTVWDHHPFLDAWIYGSLLDVSRHVTGGVDLGMFTAGVLQCALLAVSLAWGFAYAHRKGAGRHSLTVGFLLAAFLPVIPVMGMGLVKDVIHMPFMIMWTILYWHAMDSRLASFHDPRFTTVFILLGVLGSLTKKTGMYVMLLCAALLLFRRGARHVMRAVAACTMIVVVGFCGVILPSQYERIRVTKGDTVSMLVAPIQMIAGTAHDHPEWFTDRQKASFGFLKQDFEGTRAAYNPQIADPVTGYSYGDPTLAREFLTTWVEIGVRHPWSYLQHWMVMESGWLSSSNSTVMGYADGGARVESNVVRVQTNTVSNPATFGLVRADTPPSWGQSFVQAVCDTLARLPVLDVVLRVNVWTLIVPLLLAYGLWRRRRTDAGKSAWLLAVPLWANMLSLWLCAVSVSSNWNSTRYMILMLPLGVLTLLRVDALRSA